MTNCYFDQVRAKSIALKKFDAIEFKDFSVLKTEASSWGARQLILCRLVCQPTSSLATQEACLDLLPTVEDWKRVLIFPAIKDFVKGPKNNFQNLSEHALLGGEYGYALGQIWAALALIQSQDAPDTTTKEKTPLRTPTPCRTRTKTQRFPGIVDTTTALPSSSPQTPQTSRPQVGNSPRITSTPLFNSSPPLRDSQESYDLPSPLPTSATEDQVVHLALSTMRYILAHVQSSSGPSGEVNPAIEVRMAKKSLKASLLDQGIVFTAIDDGGLCRRKRSSNGKFVVEDHCVAILEAKKNDQVHDCRFIIPDALLGQMTCEALAVRAGRLTERNSKSKDETLIG